MNASTARTVGGTCALGMVFFIACGGSDSGQRLSSSGGSSTAGSTSTPASSGASGVAGASGGSGGSSGSAGAAAGVCPTDMTKMIPSECSASAVAAGNGALIDDFESAGLEIDAGDARSGGWFLYNDKTGVTSPDGNAMEQPEPVVLESGRGGSTNGLHFAGTDHVQTGDEYPWGGGVGLYLIPQCYDASAYTGVSFWAKGSGVFVFSVGTFEAQSCEFGGKCTLENCVANGKEFTLDAADDWQQISVSWDELAGGSAPFDITHLGGLTWGVKNPGTPTTPYSWDLWLDDVSFDGGTSSGSGGTSGSGSDGGSGGS